MLCSTFLFSLGIEIFMSFHHKIGTGFNYTRTINAELDEWKFSGNYFFVLSSTTDNFFLQLPSIEYFDIYRPISDNTEYDQSISPILCLYAKLFN